MYGKGGYVLLPVNHRLPQVVLNPRQVRQNASAVRVHEKNLRVARRIFEKAVRELKKRGVSVDEFYAEPVSLPHDPQALDFDAFTAADKAVYAYNESGARWHDVNVKQEMLAMAVVAAGVAVEWQYKGCSAGYGVNSNTFRRDGPPVPDWAPKRFGRA